MSFWNGYRFSKCSLLACFTWNGGIGFRGKRIEYNYFFVYKELCVSQVLGLGGFIVPVVFELYSIDIEDLDPLTHYTSVV